MCVCIENIFWCEIIVLYYIIDCLIYYCKRCFLIGINDKDIFLILFFIWISQEACLWHFEDIGLLWECRDRHLLSIISNKETFLQVFLYTKCVLLYVKNYQPHNNSELSLLQKGEDIISSRESMVYQYSFFEMVNYFSIYGELFWISYNIHINPH